MVNQDINQGTLVAACVIDLVSAVMRKIDVSGLDTKLAGNTASDALQNSYIAAKLQTHVRKQIGSV